MPVTTCPVDCQCHTGPFAACSVPGGCGSAGCGRVTEWDDRYCRTGRHCKGFDHPNEHPAYASPRDPLCGDCLMAAGHDIRALIYDYVDLAQLQAPSLSQALDTQPHGGDNGPPLPVKTGPDALQREIHHVLTTWETEVRARAHLSDPARALPGAEVQRAAGILAPRLHLLARIEPTSVYPTGCEDDPADMAGWEAIHHLQRLHKRARGMAGLTHRKTQVPGTCSATRNGRPCNGPLYRDAPRYDGDPCPIYCGRDGCNQQWTATEYDTFIGDTLLMARTRKPAGTTA